MTDRVIIPQYLLNTSCPEVATSYIFGGWSLVFQYKMSKLHIRNQPAITKTQFKNILLLLSCLHYCGRGLLNLGSILREALTEQGPSRQRPMAHPVVFKYLSYSPTLAEHAVHRLWRCLSFDRAGTCLFLPPMAPKPAFLTYLVTLKRKYIRKDLRGVGSFS